MLHINPIYKRELKQNARMKKTALMLFFYNLLLAIFGLFALYLIFYSSYMNGYRIEYANILKVYAIITGLQFILVLFIIPAMTAGTISGEREKQTLDILLTTKIAPFQIVIGKLASSISMMLLLAFSSLPIIAIVFSVGGITLIDLFQFMVLISVTAIYLGSIGVLFSAISKKTTVATVGTYMAVLFLTGGLALLLIGVGMVSQTEGSNIVNWSQDIILSKTSKYGDSILLLLINPICTFLSLTYRQTGLGVSINSIWETGDRFRYVVANYWFELSCILQLVVSVVLLWISTFLLMPLKKK